MLEKDNSFLTDFDIYLYNEGTHNKIYEKLGAHVLIKNGISGTHFAVWAPNAVKVSVVGDFNCWNTGANPLKKRGNSGIWEGFIPKVSSNCLYKYSVTQKNGQSVLKADPYAFYTQNRPDNASIVYDIEGYDWEDEDWMANRVNASLHDKPMSIYEVHLGTWASSSEEYHCPLTYLELSERLVKYVKDMGYTHIEILPVLEHPFDGSWGYQVTGYYSVTSRYGTPKEFMKFIDVCHNAGIGVILDWVPAHFPKDEHGLARFDGTALYEHENPLMGEHPEWGTYVFNHGRHEVSNFLISNAVFYFDKYHIDGIRVDAVSSMIYLDYAKNAGQWIPNKFGGRENLESLEFIKNLNKTINNLFPGAVTIAEEATSFPKISRDIDSGGLGFSFKWNMGWMNDYLKYVSMDPIFRKYNHQLLTFSMMYNYSENFILVLSHDEVVHGKKSMISKMPGEYEMKFAGLRLSYGFMYGHPGKKLMFMGNEFGQFIEWNDTKSLDWHLLNYDSHNKLQKFVQDLNKIYLENPCLYVNDYSIEGFKWIDCHDKSRSVVSFLRKGKKSKDLLIFVCNFTPVTYYDYRVGVPLEGEYEELLNSDSEIYGGGNIGNFGKAKTLNQPIHGNTYSLNLIIPPLSTLIFKPINNKKSYKKSVESDKLMKQKK